MIPRAPVLRDSTLALAALAGACADPPAPAPAAPYAPPRSVYDPPAPYLPDLPRIETTCPLAPRPAHVLLATGTELRLDDVALAPAAAPAALAGLDELALAFDPDLPYARLHPLLAALPPTIRLSLAVRVDPDPDIRHLPISAPQYGPRPARTTPLPPRTHAVHLEQPDPRIPSQDPLADPLGPLAPAAGVLVSATPAVPWARVAEALTRACTDATLIDPPPPRPPGPVDLPVALRPGVATVAGAPAPPAVQSMLAARLPDARRCFARLLLADPRARGRVDVSFTLAPDGAVTDARIGRVTLPDPDIATCLANAALRWTFARDAVPAATVVDLSFAL